MVNYCLQNQRFDIFIEYIYFNARLLFDIFIFYLQGIETDVY